METQDTIIRVSCRGSELPWPLYHPRRRRREGVVIIDALRKDEVLGVLAKSLNGDEDEALLSTFLPRGNFHMVAAGLTADRNVRDERNLDYIRQADMAGSLGRLILTLQGAYPYPEGEVDPADLPPWDVRAITLSRKRTRLLDKDGELVFLPKKPRRETGREAFATWKTEKLAAMSRVYTVARVLPTAFPVFDRWQEVEVIQRAFTDTDDPHNHKTRVVIRSVRLKVDLTEGTLEVVQDEQYPEDHEFDDPGAAFAAFPESVAFRRSDGRHKKRPDYVRATIQTCLNAVESEVDRFHDELAYLEGRDKEGRSSSLGSQRVVGH